ncbi:phage antirepressor N-terminal domain-containing protein [Streptosporangium sp. NPDC002607]
MTDIVKIPFHGGYLHTALDDGGEPVVILKPTITGMGLDWSAQYTKLQRRSWATVGQTPTVAADGKTRLMDSVGLDTWSMLLANIDENKVNEGARPIVIAYQKESAQALRNYWTQGGAINPRATASQLDELSEDIQRAKGAAEVIAILAGAGVGDRGYWDACSRRLTGRLMGETPQFDPLTKPLTVSLYLESKGLPGSTIRSVAPQFGKSLKQLYLSMYNEVPPQIEDLVGRHLVSVAQYQERHRPLFDQVYSALAVV